MSQFAVAGTIATFTALLTGFSDKGGALETITFGIEVDSATEWGALFSLRSWSVSQRPIPGGNTVYVDIGGGAGAGTLTLDNLDSHTAVLTDVSRDLLEPGSLRSRGSATFLITA